MVQMSCEHLPVRVDLGKVGEAAPEKQLAEMVPDFVVQGLEQLVQEVV